MRNAEQKQKIINSINTAKEHADAVTNNALEALSNYDPKSSESMKKYAEVCDAMGRLSDMYSELLAAMVEEAKDDIYFREPGYNQKELETIVTLVAKMMKIKDLREIKRNKKK